MNLGQLSRFLKESLSPSVRIEMPSGTGLPAHFHVTEVGKVTKEFVDCGGVRRLEQTCVLQTLVADDFDHRLSTAKLSDILDKGAALGLQADMEVDVEVQGNTIEIYRIAATDNRDGQPILTLRSKATACLAPDSCGLDVVQLSPFRKT
ncbi:MAG: DUF6428 family protein [Planctomycetota bacterium]|jgi:hypothetical protein